MRLLLPLLAAALLAAADPPPEVPDPIGLGPRLALLDFLRDQWRLKPPDGASYEALCAIYWAERRRRDAEQRDASPVLAGGAPDEADLVRDRMQRMADELRRRHGVEPPAGADEAALTLLLREAREKRDAAAREAGRSAAQRETALAAQPRPAAGASAAGGKGALAGKGDKSAKAAKTAEPAPAAAEPADPVARWKARLAALWAAREEQIPAGAALGWTAQQPELAQFANHLRWRRPGGPYEYGERDQEVEPAPGLEVWVNLTRLEPAGFGGAMRFQSSRWVPAWWSPKEARWIIEPPAKAGWIRDSQANQALMGLVLVGPAGNRERETLWRRAHEKADRDKLEEGAQLDPELTTLFIALAVEYKATLPLEQIERLSHRIERRWPLVARYEETLLAAQNQENGKETQVVRDSLRQLTELGEWMQARHEERRQHWIALVTALGALPAR